MDVPVVGSGLNKALPAFTGNFVGSVFLRISGKSFMALVGIIHSDGNLLHCQAVLGEIKVTII
jgi:hypothetical protein